MSESKVIAHDIHRVPDWLIGFMESYLDSLMPVDILHIAIGAYCDSPSNAWFDLVEVKSHEYLMFVTDGEVLEILAKELIEEMFEYLDPYLKIIIPEQQKFIASIQALDGFNFALNWDTGIVPW